MADRRHKVVLASASQASIAHRCRTCEVLDQLPDMAVCLRVKCGCARMECFKASQKATLGTTELLPNLSGVISRGDPTRACVGKPFAALRLSLGRRLGQEQKQIYRLRVIFVIALPRETGKASRVQCPKLMELGAPCRCMVTEILDDCLARPGHTGAGLKAFTGQPHVCCYGNSRHKSP
jgi:hypothetical protein